MQMMAAAEQGRYASCLEIASKMKREGIQPDYSTYSALLQAAAHEGAWLDAWAILDDMVLVGIKPTTTSFNHLLYVCRPISYSGSFLMLGRLNGNVLHNMFGQSLRR